MDAVSPVLASRASPMVEILTADDIRSVPVGGEISVERGAIITAWAREVAATRGVRIAEAGPGADKPAVAVGGDHGGFALKERIKARLAGLGHRTLDMGAFSEAPVDYPDIALAVALAVKRGDARFGILVDGAGIGSAMAANKVPGVRAALCVDAAAAKNAREHNDANVLTLGAKFADPIAIVEVFLTAQCTEERHLRRVGKIKAIEGSYSK